MNVAYIPARGGSKGIKDKNKKLMCGRPLVMWSIIQALNAECVAQVLVSSDDEWILEYAVQAGATPIQRAAHLATDEAQIEDSIIAEVRDAENVILLQPTSPLRRPYDIDRAFEHFKEAHADSLLSMVEEAHHFVWGRDRGLRWVPPYVVRPRRQDMKLGFRETGSIYISRLAGLVERRQRLFGKIAAYTMEEFQGYEVDTETDWVVVESLMEKML